MSMFPTAMECLASRLEDAESCVKLLEIENGILRNRVSELIVERNELLENQVEKFLTEIEGEALVELADKLAPILGQTKDVNFKNLVRNYLKKQRVCTNDV